VNPPGQSLNQYKFRTQSKRAKFKLWTTRHTAEKQVSLILRTAHISEHKQRKCLHLWLRMNPGTVSISTQTPSPRQWCCWCDHWVRIDSFTRFSPHKYLLDISCWLDSQECGWT
jgi:hypothetical protein